MDERIKLLLAEDEPALGQIIKESLETRHFEVRWCKNGEEALKDYIKYKPQILVLDVMMPKKDGFTLAKEIRAIDQEIPIIFLTAKSQTSDVIEGFSLGGNDYLKKPFSMEELIVRVHNLLQINQKNNHADIVNIGDYTFDFPRQKLQYKTDKPIALTHREALLLFYLEKSKNKVLDRSLILQKLWGTDDYFTARSMDVFITKLRKKLRKDTNVQIINVRGFGYKLVV